MLLQAAVVNHVRQPAATKEVNANDEREGKNGNHA